jgi:hypothetical protein
MTPENPPGFVVRTEAQQAASDNGYRLERDIADGWLHYASTTAPGSSLDRRLLRPWPLAPLHRSLRRCGRDRLGKRFATRGPWRCDLVFSTIKELHVGLDRVYKLAMSLPEAPLDRFKAKTANLHRATEAERWVWAWRSAPSVDFFHLGLQ